MRFQWSVKLCITALTPKNLKSVNDRTSDPNGREKHVIAKSGALRALLTNNVSLFA